VSIVKLEIGEKLSRSGFMWSSRAFSISQDDGVAVGVKREKVRWYVREYFMERVVHLARDSATSGARAFGIRSGGEELVDNRYAIIACSSANMSRKVLAMYVAREDVEEELEGTWLGV
jgi:hypothetical protein